MAKINILAFAQVHGIVLGFVGLLCGIFYAFGGAIVDTLVTLGWITSAETPGLSYGTALAFMAVVMMPLLFGSFGFAVGGIVAFLYNLIAKYWKRELDLEQ